MKKGLKVLLATATLFTLASCGGNTGTDSANKDSATNKDSTSENTTPAKEYKGYAVGAGFASHGDVAFANITIDESKKVVDAQVREVFGIRSVGNIVNNRTYGVTATGELDGTETTVQADVDKCEAIDAENKLVTKVEISQNKTTGVWSAKNYESYKYLQVGGKLLICQAAGAAPVYDEDAEEGYKDINALLKNNTTNVITWWINALEANDVKFLKVAHEGDTVVATATDGTKLAVLSDGFNSFYGSSIYKDQNYTSKVPTYAASFVNLNNYIKENGVDFDVESDEFDAACSLQSAAAYLAVAKAAYDDAVSKIA